MTVTGTVSSCHPAVRPQLLLQRLGSSGATTRWAGLLGRAHQRVGVVGRLRLAPEEPLDPFHHVANTSIERPSPHPAALLATIIPPQ